MCRDDIPSEEQQELVRHAAADDTGTVRVRRRKLSLFPATVADHLHPTFAQSKGAGRAKPGLATWENEGGRVTRIKPLGKRPAERSVDRRKPAIPSN